MTSRKRPDMLGLNNIAKRPEVRAKISASKRGALNPMKRPEVRARVSASSIVARAAAKALAGIGIDEKHCPGCRTVKKMTEFHVGTNYCKKCHKERVLAYGRRNPERVQKWQRVAHLRSEFNMTIDEYEKMLGAQGGGCGICGAPTSPDGRRLAVDHCHATGRVRGLLCQTCNTALGGLEHHLDNAAAYLRRSLGGGHPYAGGPP